MGKQYETQDRSPLDAANETAYVWRCARCGRFLARIERLDGVLEVYHKCGEMNRLDGALFSQPREDRHRAQATVPTIGEG